MFEIFIVLQLMSADGEPHMMPMHSVKNYATEQECSADTAAQLAMLKEQMAPQLAAAHMQARVAQAECRKVANGDDSI